MRGRRKILTINPGVRVAGAALVLVLAGGPAVFAQSPNVPVRRAEPVTTPIQTRDVPTDPNQIQNPAWMERVQPARPVGQPDEAVAEPRATPFRPPNAPPPPDRSLAPIPADRIIPPAAFPVQESTPVPREVRTALPVERAEPVDPAPPSETAPTPVPLQAATPVPVQAATPLPQAIPPVQAATPDQAARPAETDRPGSIRIGPSVDTGLDRPRQIQGPKDYADAFYARKMFDLAIPEYEAYLATAQLGEDRTTAWFRLAESFRNLQQVDRARRAYETLLRETRQGEFAGAAAYRLGGILMDEKMFSNAATNFEIAAREAQDPAVRLSAQFFAGRCYELTGDRRRAFEAFEKVRAAEGSDTRYQEYTLSAMARLASELGRVSAAIPLYEELAEKSQNPTTRIEAMLRGAQLLLEVDKTKEARELLARAMKEADTPATASLARFGVLEIDYASGDFEKVAATTAQELEVMPADSQSRAFLLVANARRQAGDYDGALTLYDQILSRFPDQDAAQEAKFQRLVCLFRKDDPGLMEALNRFLMNARDPSEVAQARMLKAETHYAAGEWAEAAEAYGALGNARLPERLQADAVFKQAWSFGQIGDTRASVTAYSDFIERFPEHEFLPKALIGRGMAHLQNGAHDAALRDFDRVLQHHPESAEREMALLQRALSFGSRRDYSRMQADFEQLVSEFPDSAARAQAEFWIGFAKYEAKDYSGALPHLKEARQRDPEAYRERANLRMMMAYYFLENPTETAREIEENEIPNVPAEVYQWLAGQFLEKGNHASAEKYLQLVLDGKAGDAPTPELYLQLAQSRILQKKFAEAKEPAEKYLEIVREPAPRARGLLTQAEAWLGAGEFDQARKLVEDAQLLQPEGRLNAEARLLAGRVHSARGEHAEAARSFMTVAVLYDDPALSPQALLLAAEAYRELGQNSEADEALAELRRRYPEAEKPVEG
jgi:tetratricopeptide (TPR) repeat protein